MNQPQCAVPCKGLFIFDFVIKSYLCSLYLYFIVHFLMENIDNNTADENSSFTFSDLGLSKEILHAVEKKGFTVPTPIQSLAIPKLLSGEKNIIAKARTGTGKTAAFALPVIQNIIGKKGTTRALILEPTRELAMQTEKEMVSFIPSGALSCTVLYGQSSYSKQIRDLRGGAEIVVGTPGRIKDHLERGTLDISGIDYFILDEGDEMLDMGFVDDIEAIFSHANSECKVLLFSATVPKEILEIARKFMGKFEIIEEQGVKDEPLQIEQKFWILRESEKLSALMRLIDFEDDFYGVIFTRTKNDADNVCMFLSNAGFKVASLHGDILQSEREKTLLRFKKRDISILVATDVAARGIDVSDLTHVVNYSIPFDAETYVHRVGRTGRAGKKGSALTFVSTGEKRRFSFMRKRIEKLTKNMLIEEDVPNVKTVIRRKRERILEGLKEKVLSVIESSGENGELSGGLGTFVEQFLENNSEKDLIYGLLNVFLAEEIDKKRYGVIEKHVEEKLSGGFYRGERRERFWGRKNYFGDRGRKRERPHVHEPTMRNTRKRNAKKNERF